MSKLMSWTGYCMKADKSLVKHATSSVKSGSEARYQLKGIAELASVKRSIMSWREHAIRSAILPERKRFCLKIDGYLRTAYARASDQPTGPISGLREPFMLLKMALKQLMIIRNFDERVRVKAAETPRANREAEDTCGPSFLNTESGGKEIEASLKSKDWLKQFILDSRNSERLAVVSRERLLKVLEEFRRQKRAIDSGQGSQKGLDINMLT
ncbi:hypothetical protein PG994_007603 [Apiospora phragmitis]|uniref:Uncharacterized protein n=1 Tax=Apiospora phragmitis TaxID=2905665 RepID=A0ABR1URD3_9PEZI